MSRSILFVAPNSWVVRNWLSTGLADLCADELGLEPVFVSHFNQDSFTSAAGRSYRNIFIPAVQGGKGELPVGFSRLLYWLYSVRLRTFALDVPLGSIQMMQLSRRKDIVNRVLNVVRAFFPLQSKRRALLRRLIDSLNPHHELSAAAIRQADPAFLITGSPGFQYLDQVLMIEAQRRHIPVHCVVNSWDNMTSRGAIIRRPDTMMVWNEFMRGQASDIHQYPKDRVHVVGSLQFCRYREPLNEAEVREMYERLGISFRTPYVLFLTGQHVPNYEAEDVAKLLDVLPSTRFAGLPVVVRIHPQADNAPFVALGDRVVLDVPPKFSAKGEKGSHFGTGEMRAMAALLQNAALVVSSWGTTALLEAAIFDRPIMQLRWMNAFERRHRAEADRVYDFQKYIHLIPFDATNCRMFNDAPERLASDLDALIERDDDFRRNRARAVADLATVPLEAAPSRVVEVLREKMSR